jgi:xanthine dehydrogenase accessory factor
MDSIDFAVLQACVQWLAAGWRCEYVTVVRTWGSSPRPQGATMAIRADGLVAGSVSGGCIEDDLIAAARAQGITRSVPQLLTYGISADEAHRFGLPCGGTIQLLAEPLGPHSRMAELWQRVGRRELTRRMLDLGSGQVELAAAGADAPLHIDAAQLVTYHGPRLRLLIIGAGGMSLFLARIAAALEYQVTICDPRQERQASLEPGIALVRSMPDDAVLAMRPDRRSAVITLTHDPKLDDMALMEALRTEAFYIGAIGSRFNHARRCVRLRHFDLTPQQIARLRGPAGVYIGSKTPYEIALSILAELTAAKNGVALPPQLGIVHGKASHAGQPATLPGCAYAGRE